MKLNALFIGAILIVKRNDKAKIIHCTSMMEAVRMTHMTLTIMEGIRNLNDFLTWNGITINMLKGMADALHAEHDGLKIAMLNRNQIRMLADDYSDGMPPEFIREELKALADNNHGMLADMFK